MEHNNCLDDNNLRYYQSIRKNYGSDDYLVISYQVEDTALPTITTSKKSFDCQP
jgi:hypothetical protein